MAGYDDLDFDVTFTEEIAPEDEQDPDDELEIDPEVEKILGVSIDETV